MKKILIVDDEKSFLLSLKDGLKKHSGRFQVFSAENGRQAIEILRSMSIDLLVTDLKMPEMNGFELLAWTSRHQPQLPVIVMSAFGTPEIEARLDKMDTLQFLEKPLDIDMLEEGILSGLNAAGKSYIRGITLATFLQLMKAEKKNCTLKIMAEGQLAYLFISRGELIDAEMDRLTGVSAAMEIVAWSDAEIEMDGICRRSDDVIQMPMEQLLIEAFKRQDEAAEMARTGEADVDSRTRSNGSALASESEDLLRKRLATLLTRLAPVQEFLVFADNGNVESQSQGMASLSGSDPHVFSPLFRQIPEEMGVGGFRSLVLNGTNRNRYLLFNQWGRKILILLKPGIQANKVIREIKRHMNR